ncbi:suppressor of fused domain protein [Sporosarcina sp. Te-1]|uniref:suppressor of fused domain protein n=1 Tax=Sporosarcina sp. Te-1 TaxID=2818390 RepID=UPI001A9F125A|nr:suppressor of fused domain protein [Sporosarcina sp. Te-1]QTD39789.1 suppressor of fused domain protein [Sporosarcina sp. Te-1]
MSEEVMTTGWDAIDQAVKTIYGEQEPKHYGTLISYALGGSDPLDGISVYKADKPVAHWHFVTYGFSELYEKETDNSEESGYGFELTCRLVRQEDEEEPPAWALNLLQNMGRYVFTSGNVFQAGDYLDANGPICLGVDTELTALAFVEDPELEAIDTPNGRVEFLQMVGITHDELEAMQTWNTLGVLAAGLPQIPFYVTDLERGSLLTDKSVAEAVYNGTEKEGSNTGFLFVDQLDWDAGKKGWLRKSPSVLTIGAKQAEIIGKLLRGRLLKGKELTLSGAGIRVRFAPGDQSGFEQSDDLICITLNEEAVGEMSRKLLPKQGEFEVPVKEGLSVHIAKTTITDQEGNIVKTFG